MTKQEWAAFLCEYLDWKWDVRVSEPIEGPALLLKLQRRSDGLEARTFVSRRDWRFAYSDKERFALVRESVDSALARIAEDEAKSWD